MWGAEDRKVGGRRDKSGCRDIDTVGVWCRCLGPFRCMRADSYLNQRVSIHIRGGFIFYGVKCLTSCSKCRVYPFFKEMTKLHILELQNLCWKLYTPAAQVR